MKSMQIILKRIHRCFYIDDRISIRAPVEYKVIDAVNYNFKAEYDVIVDKGTLDALNCGDFEVVEKLIMQMEYPFVLIMDVY